MRPYVVPLDVAETLRREYEEGATTTKLSQKYGISKATVSRQIRRVGGEIRPQPTNLKAHRGLLGWVNS